MQCSYFSVKLHIICETARHLIKINTESMPLTHIFRTNQQAFSKIFAFIKEKVPPLDALRQQEVRPS